MSDVQNLRQIKGYSILAKGDIPVMINKENFLVPSQLNHSKYKVIHLDGWTCEYMNFIKRKQLCKHIYTTKKLILKT
ncbi:MAG: hypothetical protein HYT70_02360 [Candidatus Aenigmarchaeota archaeon]|nr:hypothetical protein [Candidatus Aenigmarchaeota archaeon]